MITLIGLSYIKVHTFRSR